MRSATLEELPEIVNFIYERFSNLEHFNFLTEYMDHSEEVLKKFIETELLLFLKHGKVQIYGEPIVGMISSIPSKKLTLFRQFLYSLPSRKILKELPVEDRKQLLYCSDRSRKRSQRHWCDAQAADTDLCRLSKTEYGYCAGDNDRSKCPNL